MSRLFANALLLLLAALLTACAGQQIAQVSSQQYIVKRGDTLSSIAWRFQLDYRALAHWNRISEPYTIHPGQRLFLNPTQQARVTQPVSPQQGSGAPALAGRAPQRPYAPPSSKAPPAAPEPKIYWRWPTQGRVVKGFSASGSGGVDIKGVEGQAVVASAPGSVVYSGTGLKGYGELVIIRHSRTWLSAYAHNRNRFVKEGDVVAAGQKIAELGKNNKGDSVLHFEIRKYGKPVDPMGFFVASSK